MSGLNTKTEIVQHLAFFIGFAQTVYGYCGTCHKYHTFAFVIFILNVKGKEKVNLMVKKGLSCKTITHPPDSFDILSIGIVLFELASDITHMNFYCFVIVKIRLTPYTFKNISLREKLLRMIQHKLQYCKLLDGNDLFVEFMLI